MGRVGGRLLSIGDLIVYRPPPFIGFKSSLWAGRLQSCRHPPVILCGARNLTHAAESLR